MEQSQPNSNLPPAESMPAPEGEGKTPKIWQIVVAALIAIAFTALWLGLYQFLNQVIWGNAFILQNRWTLPVLVLFFSLIVGFARKYLHAPSVIRGGAIEGITGEKEQPTDHIPFLGTLLSSYGSLLSGASIGPEGALAYLVLQISLWLQKRIRVSKDAAPGFQMAALSSAYNGIIGSPLFTGMLATEMRVGGIGPRAAGFLIWNLLAGLIGFFFFVLLGLPTFAQEVPFTPITELTLSYGLIAIFLGVLGAGMAVLIGALFRVFERGMDRAFKDNAIARILAAAIVISIVGYFYPQVLFAGETQIFPMIENPAEFGVQQLVLFGLLKLVMLALAFKSGYIGGPTFPILFAATMFGLALSLVFPTIPVSIFVLCLETAVLTLVLRAPLTAILLVAVVGTADTNEIALLVLSGVTAMVLGIIVTRQMERRSANGTNASPEAPNVA